MRKLPLTGVLGQGKFALVDDEDFDYLSQWSWHLANTGYPRRTKRIGARREDKSVSVQLHYEIAVRAGVFDKDLVCDHLDRNRLNNQRVNLRYVTKSENSFNTSHGLPKSGYRGVARANSKWQARVGSRSNQKYLGVFDTAYKAHLFRTNYLKEKGLVVPV